jgi:hypothetical protein
MADVERCVVLLGDRLVVGGNDRKNAISKHILYGVPRLPYDIQSTVKLLYRSKPSSQIRKMYTLPARVVSCNYMNMHFWNRTRTIYSTVACNRKLRRTSQNAFSNKSEFPQHV